MNCEEKLKKIKKNAVKLFIEEEIYFKENGKTSRDALDVLHGILQEIEDNPYYSIEDLKNQYFSELKK
jgi:hypothetical protein